MLTTIDLRGDRSDPTDRLPRASEQTRSDVRSRVADIVADVRVAGDAGILRWTAELDGWDIDDAAHLVVDRSACDNALASLSPTLRDSLERAAEQVRWFHARGRPADWIEERDGARVGVRHSPLQRVGVYVPGGRAAYPSTVLMTVVPARVAGVDQVVLCTPPGADGVVDQTILAAAALTGVDVVLRIGGAQAIAALAYGTSTVPRCDKVVGPGNAFVAEAKQQVYAAGACGIDALTGPTEVAIIADDSADPRHVAADLVAQAEHDPLATCLLITPSEALADKVAAALSDEVGATAHRERVEQALTGQGAVALVDDLDHAVAVADAFAAEHLEVQTAEPVATAEKVRFAGAIFVGAHSPVSLGDYAAGPNHTLPTSGAARFTGGLRTDDFFVPVNWVEYSRPALAALAPVVTALGTAENLPAHVRAVQVRLGDSDERNGG